MIQVSIIKRTLREGRTYDDFRDAWYHSVGFGATNRMLTSLNVANPREVVVIRLTELTTLEQASSWIAIDAKERQEHTLDDIVEPDIQRTFGILVSDQNLLRPESRRNARVSVTLSMFTNCYATNRHVNLGGPVRRSRVLPCSAPVRGPPRWRARAYEI
jgi:hypothetical protein